MSVMIETTEELLALVKKTGLKVSSVDELRNLLTMINAHYNPQAARIRTAKLVALGVSCGVGGIAAFVSLMLMFFASQSNLAGDYFVGSLALIWGGYTLVSIVALLFSFILLFGRHSSAPVDAPPASRSSSFDERVMTGAPHDLSL
jgi:hypothetical protein